MALLHPPDSTSALVSKPTRASTAVNNLPKKPANCPVPDKLAVATWALPRSWHNFELCRAANEAAQPCRRPERSAVTCCDAGLLTRCSARCQFTDTFLGALSFSVARDTYMSRAAKLGSRTPLLPRFWHTSRRPRARVLGRVSSLGEPAAPGRHAADQGRGWRTPKNLARLPCYSHKVGTAPIFPGTGHYKSGGRHLRVNLGAIWQGSTELFGRVRCR
jgi:hypothetical protein